MFFRALAIFPALAIGAPFDAHATTRTFRQVSAKDFEEGEATGTTILPGGELAPGLVPTLIRIDAAFAWCATVSRDGQTAYFGTGDQGKIFATPIRGASGTEQPGRRVADLDAAWVTALATRPDGTLLAGTTPGGKIYTVEPKSGAAKPLAQTGADHVWALVHDDKSGWTFAATGSPGKIVAIDVSGKARQIWDSGDKHVVSLARDPSGTLLAGTSEEAILYRVRPDGHAEALQDFEAEEVRAIVRSPFGVHVAVNDFEKSAASSPAPGPVAARGTKITIPTTPPPSASALARPGARRAKSAIYHVTEDGRIEQIFALPDGYLTAIAVGEDGSVFAGTGTLGRVFRILPDRSSSLIIDLPERQALALIRSGDTFLVGTGDVGGIYRAQPPKAGGGRYLSKVLDAEFPALWGALHWHGRSITFETRAGNTAKPDPGWTEWKPLDRPQPSGAGGSGKIASPAARYLQYRAVLGNPDSRLRSVIAHYLPQNQRPRVTEISLDTSGAGGGTMGGAARPQHSTILKLRWKVENPDGDELVYRLSFREQSEAVWRPVPNGDAVTKTEYDWNTDGLPDGTYVVRVTASDERAHPPERALSSSFDSAPLLVDNRKPEILGLEVRYPFLAGRARDDASPITQIEIAIDGGEWRIVRPSDGIADQLVEPFNIKLPVLSPGPHAISVRAWDSADNVGAAQIGVRREAREDGKSR